MNACVSSEHHGVWKSVQALKQDTHVVTHFSCWTVKDNKGGIAEGFLHLLSGWELQTWVWPVRVEFICGVSFEHVAVFFTLLEIFTILFLKEESVTQLYLPAGKLCWSKKVPVITTKPVAKEKSNSLRWTHQHALTKCLKGKTQQSALALTVSPAN